MSRNCKLAPLHWFHSRLDSYHTIQIPNPPEATHFVHALHAAFIRCWNSPTAPESSQSASTSPTVFLLQRSEHHCLICRYCAWCLYPLQLDRILSRTSVAYGTQQRGNGIACGGPGKELISLKTALHSRRPNCKTSLTCRTGRHPGSKPCFRVFFSPSRSPAATYYSSPADDPSTINMATLTAVGAAAIPGLPQKSKHLIKLALVIQASINKASRTSGSARSSNSRQRSLST